MPSSWTCSSPVSQNGRPVTSRDYYLKSVKPIHGRVIDTDIARDLAVIELDEVSADATELKPAPAGASPGERLHSIGNPSISDAMWAYCSGSVRAACHKRWSHLIDRQNVMRDCNVLETTLPINHGDSGGPVVNDNGELVAVVSTFQLFDTNREPVQTMTWHIDVAEVKLVMSRTRRLRLPQTAADYDLRGVRYRLRGRLDLAIADLTRAIQLDPKLARAYAHRAECFLAKRDFVTAGIDCDEAIRLAPDDFYGHNVRGIILGAQGDRAAAIAAYSKAIQLNAKDAVVYANRAGAYYEQGDNDPALADYSEAIRLNPTYAWAYNGRGNAYLAKKDYEHALADYGRAIDHDFAYPASVRTNAGYALYQMKRPELALKLFDEALKIDQRYARAHFWRGAIYEDVKEYALAEQEYGAAVALDGNFAKQTPVRQVSLLKVVNHTGETLRIHLQYEALVNGQWTWLPADPKDSTLSYTVAPGQSSFLAVKDIRIEARRVRI